MNIDELKHVVGECKKDKPALIRFFDQVNAESSQKFISEFLWLQECICPSKIIVLINCEGGSVMYGMSVFSVIKSCPIDVECVVEGIAASMGSVIWSAGKRSYMHDYSLLMIHNPLLPNHQSVKEDKDAQNMINAFSQQLEMIYHKRFGLQKDVVAKIMNGEDGADGTFFTAKEAVDANIIPASHIIKTSKQTCDKVKNAIEETKDIIAIKDVMNSISLKNDTNKLSEMIDAIPKQIEHENLQLETNTNKNEMDKEQFSFGAVSAQLGFPEGSPVAHISGRITELLSREKELETVTNALDELKLRYTGKETEVTNLTSNLDSVNAELQKYKDAEQASKVAEINAMIDAAVASGKIEESTRPIWLEMAQNKLELTKATLEAIPARQVISAEIANDPNNIRDAKNTLDEVTNLIAKKVVDVVGNDFELKTF